MLNCLCNPLSRSRLNSRPRQSLSMDCGEDIADEVGGVLGSGLAVKKRRHILLRGRRCPDISVTASCDVDAHSNGLARAERQRGNRIAPPPIFKVIQDSILCNFYFVKSQLKARINHSQCQWNETLFGISELLIERIPAWLSIRFCMQ